MACCPFHSDKSPSMKLDERYYCFGCGATGDAVDLTAKLFEMCIRDSVEGVKNGEITACICKDMSRIGRDHLQVGFFTDILFREKEVRFIAINNGIDSDRQETSEFAPFLNIMNEWFVRDTSKKIKAVLKSRGSSGNAHTSNIPPYGYLKDPENPDHWIIDRCV